MGAPLILRVVSVKVRGVLPYTEASERQWGTGAHRALICTIGRQRALTISAHVAAGGDVSYRPRVEQLDWKERSLPETGIPGSYLTVQWRARLEGLVAGFVIGGLVGMGAIVVTACRL